MEQIVQGLIANTATHDLHLRCRGGREVSLHRAFMAQASPVLFRLLYGPLRPSTDEAGIMTLPLPDQEYEAAAAFVEYCYFGGGDLAMDQIPALLEMARQYECPLLTAQCSKQLADAASAANAVDFLLYSAEYGLSELLQLSRDYLVQSFSTIVEQHPTAFTRCPASELQSAFTSDKLDVTREEQAFDALVLWADAQPRGSADIMPLLLTMRFGTMPPTYLREHVAPHQLLGRTAQGAELKAAVLALAEELDGSAASEREEQPPAKRGRTMLKNSPAATAGAASSSSGSSGLLARALTPVLTRIGSSLGGELGTPLEARIGVRLAQAAQGGKLFTYKAGEPDNIGLFEWLGSDGGTEDWQNPALRKLVSTSACTTHNLTGKAPFQVRGHEGIVARFKDGFERPSYVSRDDIENGVANYNGSFCCTFGFDEISVDLKRSFVLSGLLLMDYDRDYCSFEAEVRGSDDGSTWIRLASLEFPKIAANAFTTKRVRCLSDVANGRLEPNYHAIDNQEAYRHYRLVAVPFRDSCRLTPSLRPRRLLIRQIEMYGALAATQGTEAVGSKRRRCVDGIEI